MKAILNPSGFILHLLFIIYVLIFSSLILFSDIFHRLDVTIVFALFLCCDIQYLHQAYCKLAILQVDELEFLKQPNKVSQYHVAYQVRYILHTLKVLFISYKVHSSSG